MGTGPLVRFVCRGVTPVAWSDLGLPPSVGDITAPAKSCLHAVLISGGWKNSSSYSRYAENLISMYNILRGCGYPKSQIYTYYAEGSELLDLDNADGDGIHLTGNDVTGAADETLIRDRIAGQCDSLDQARDVLFIYVTNHGESGGCAMLWDFDNDGFADGNELYRPSELAADIENGHVCREFIVQSTFNHEQQGKFAESC